MNRHNDLLRHALESTWRRKSKASYIVGEALCGLCFVVGVILIIVTCSIF